MMRESGITVQRPEPALGAVPSEEALDRLVYLVGPTRSGTSVIYNCLGLHPRALGFPALTYFVNRVWRYRHRVDERTWRALLHQTSYFRPKEVIQGLGEQTGDRLSRRYSAALKRKDFAELYRLYPLFYALSAECDKDPAAIGCWTDKANNWRGLSAIRRALPQARFVFVVRDPRSVVLSNMGRSLRRQQRRRDSAPDLGEVVEAGLYWRVMMLMLLRFASRHPGSVAWVRYEDFVTDPTRELNRLFTFMVGEGLAEDELAALLGTVGGGATNRADETYSGISDTPRERWRHELGAAEVAVIGSIAGRTARRFGYQLAPSPPSVALAAIFAMPRPVEKLAAAARLAAAVLLERLVADAFPLAEPRK